jgi:carbon monoxide dehydrogenase subunit G
VKFEHTIVVNAPLEAVTTFFADVPQVAVCVPGVEEAAAVGPDEYEGRLQVRLGPVGFSLSGRAQLERDGGEAWRLRGEGRDRRVGAGVDGTLEARFQELDSGETEVHVTADVHLSGRLGQLGQPLIRRKADAMVREFAENVREALAG